jgi:histidinol dehydrogenase
LHPDYEFAGISESGAVGSATAHACKSNCCEITFSRGAILLVDSLDEAVEIANRIAPEHLTLPAALAPAVQNAGSIFLDEFTPQSAGDYISGPNHVLPTGAMARVRGGLSVLDFVRSSLARKFLAKGFAALLHRPLCWRKPRACADMLNRCG